MKVCVFGAGAVGGNLAARLVAAKADEVSVVARGAMLNGIRERGLTVRCDGAEIGGMPFAATDDPYALPPQDLVIVTLKAHTAPAAAEAIGRLIAPRGCAVFATNGIPWWWRHGLAGAGGPLPLLDPGGALWTQVRPERVLGCVIYSPSEIVAPGIIEHTGFNRFILGEPDGSSSARLEAAIGVFSHSQAEVKSSADLRRDILRKVVRNASSNGLCALSRVDVLELGTNAELSALVRNVMHETLAVGAALGWDLRGEVNVDKEAGPRSSMRGKHPSMLQDVLRGKPLEVEAVIGQIQAFAREKSVAVPTIDVILPLLRGLDRWLRTN